MYHFLQYCNCLIVFSTHDRNRQCQKRAYSTFFFHLNLFAIKIVKTASSILMKNVEYDIFNLNLISRVAIRRFASTNAFIASLLALTGLPERNASSTFTFTGSKFIKPVRALEYCQHTFSIHIGQFLSGLIGIFTLSVVKQ